MPILDAVSTTSFDWAQLLLPAVIAFGAAWAGAYFAFRFQNSSAREDRITSQIDAINAAAMTLGQMQNELSIYKRQIIDPYEGYDHKAIAMQPSVLGDCSALILHCETLSFLCETDFRQVPIEVGYTNTLFRRAVGMIDDRTNHHRFIVQPRMAAAVPASTPLTDAIIEKALGVDQKRQQEGLTESMELYVSESLKQIDKCISDLKAAGNALYEKGRVITIEMENKDRQD